MMRLIGFMLALIILQVPHAAKQEPVYIHGDNGIEIDHQRREVRAFKNAYVKRGEITLFGNALYAFYAEKNKKIELSHAEAYGSVKAVAPDKIIEAREGRYDAKKDVILFRGDVKITKDNHHLSSQYALMDRKTGRTTILNYDPFDVTPLSVKARGQVRILLKG